MKAMQRILIWDLPTRLFHWTLASCFAIAWLSSEGDRWRSIHVFVGYTMLALVAFRLIWGFAGSHFSRFASFWFRPAVALRYARDVLQRRAERHIGHNPAGSLAIYLLLALVVVIGATGILTLGGEEGHSIAAGWFTIHQIQRVKQLHELLAYAMLLVVAGHITGVVVESVLHSENLAHSMVTGYKLASGDTPHARAHATVAGLMLVAMLGFGGWWFAYAVDRHLDVQAWHGTPETGQEEAPHVRFVGKSLPDNQVWRKECKVCHVSYYPALLPARSWEKIIADQSHHFEDNNDLELDQETTAIVLKFLVDNAADHHRTEAAYKIDRSIPKSETPLRITETPYWLDKHRDIEAAVWKSPQVKRKSNCSACHTDAAAGTFEDSAMHLPDPTPATHEKGVGPQ